MDPTVEYVDRGADRLAMHVYPDPGSGPVALFLPAMGTRARFYRPFAEALHRHGIAAAVADLRGTGASTPAASRASRYGYADLVDDVGALRAALGSRLDGRPLLLAGHSLGGQLALLHLAVAGRTGGTAGGTGVAGLVLLAAAPPYWRHYPAPGRYATRAVIRGIGAAAAALGYWPGWGFGGRQARRVMTDWAATARDGRYAPLHGVDTEAAIAALTTPVLAVSVEPDRYVPAALVDFLVTKLAAAPVERAHFTAGALGAPVDHFRWVPASGPIAAHIANWTAAAPGR